MVKQIRVLIFLAFYFSSFKILSQSVSNVRAFEEDGTVMIVYDLFTTKPEKEFYVSLYASKDNGNTFKAVYEAKGDVDKNVKTGTERTITWEPASGHVVSLVFKVEAQAKREKETSMALIIKNFNHSSGNLELLSVERERTTIEFIFSFINNRKKGEDTFAAANFFLLDDKEKVHREAEMEINGHEGNAFNVKSGQAQILKLRIKDIPENVISFSKVEFNLSEIAVKFADVKIGL